jgi:leader peptidase (prepilin peptidase)/N-methyltransferase
MTLAFTLLAPWGVDAMPALPADVPEPWLSIMLSPGARIFAFVWGLLWGSFANVLIYRMPRGMSFVRPRSRCPHCETPVAGYDNIPVLSFLILRGKCRHCKEPLSLRYLVVELLCGILSFALYMQLVYVPLLAGQHGSPIAWALWLAFGLGLVAIIDPSLLGVPWEHALASAAGGFLLFAAIHLYYTRVRGIDGLGLGDAKLLLMVGAFTGPVGLFWTIAAGALQGTIVSVPMLLAGKKVANTELKDIHGDDPELGEDDPDRVTGKRVPFGPFLALAAMEYLLLRKQIDGLLAWWVGG